jgi:L-asparaginase
VSQRPRILFLHTGGTLGMSWHDDPGVLTPASPAPDLSLYIPALSQVAEVDGRVLANVDSADITPADWATLARTISDAHADYDGFVVLHGTDTMAFTAAALSFMLQGSHKSVVLTGSQRPLAEPRTDARANLVHSAICAGMEIPEVGLYFGSHLFRGNRATKTSIHAYEAFASPNHPPLVEIGVDIERSSAPLQRKGPLALYTETSTDVAVLSVFPGMSPKQLSALAAFNRVIVLRGFGEGNLPQDGWPEAIRAASEGGTHVIVMSQCRAGASRPGRYLGSELAREAGALFSGDMTGEATVVKSMWLLGQGAVGDDFCRRFVEPIAGEISRGSCDHPRPSSHAEDVH